jgi:hypothetical protein
MPSVQRESSVIPADFRSAIYALARRKWPK